MAVREVSKASQALAGTVFALTAGLVLLGIGGVVANFAEQRSSLADKVRATSEVRTASFDPGADRLCPLGISSQPSWRAEVEVEQVDIAKHTLTVGILLCPSSRVTVVRTANPSARLQRGDVVLDVDEGRSGFTATIPMDPPSVFVGASTSVDIPAVDVSNSYPSDTYLFDLSLATLAGPAASVSGVPSSPFSAVPTQLVVGKGAALEGSDVAWTQASTAQEFGPFRGAHVLVTRGRITQAFVYAMAFLPLIIIVMMVHLFALGRTRPDRTDVRNLLLAMSGVFLAILPLRTVLVPPDVTGITRVDLILATELAALLLTVTGAYARSVGAAALLIRRRRPPAGTPTA